MKSYPWYEIVDSNEPLSQGDIINSCPIVIPTAAVNSKKIKAELIEYNVIVMSHSCDLKYKKVEIVLVCPLYSLEEAEKKYDFLKSTDKKNAIREGAVPAYHLLNKCDLKGFENGFLLVTFHDVYGVPYSFLLSTTKKNGKRLRLLSPYKEHLSQAFARFFMRVGLPIDIPKFKIKK